MTKIRLIVAAAAAIFICVLAQAQYTQVVGVNITDDGGNKLASGRICMLGTDANNNPISYRLGYGATVAISSVTRATNVVTVVTSASHGLVAGQVFIAAGVTDTTFNGTWIVASVTNSTTFTFAQTATNATSGGGTIRPDGGQVISTPACAAITSGAIVGTFKVADTSLTTPQNVCMRTSVINNATGAIVVSYPNALQTVKCGPQPSGSLWSFDNYSPNLTPLTVLTVPLLTDPTLAANSNTAAPTQAAVKQYVDSVSLLPKVVATYNNRILSADIGTVTLYSVPAVGFYRASCYVAVAAHASSSSTLPSCSIRYVDRDSNTHGTTVATVSPTTTCNADGCSAISQASATPAFFEAFAGTTIAINVSGYASNPSTTMTYSVFAVLEYLGQP
jgi:hypothetical protein